MKRVLLISVNQQSTCWPMGLLFLQAWLKAHGHRADILVERDIAGVVEVAGRRDVPVKVILETCLLTDDEKVTACQIAERAGARFVKTSTATQPGGATVEDIRLMRKSVSEKVVVKASAYVTTIEKVLALYEAGARRFGTGYTRQILEGLQALSRTR